MDFVSTDSIRNANPLKYAQEITFRTPLPLELGQTLPEIRIVYETYGQLNEKKDNAVLLCHALSGDSHAAAHDSEDDPGWWEIMVGPGKPIDTRQFFVICSNCLGGCRGTTGPNDINPQTGKRYGTSFPEITVGDIVEAQNRLIEHLGINRLLAVIGGSLGGINAIEWATRFPDKIAAAVPLAAGSHLTSQALAFDIVARNAIQSDPNFHGGEYHEYGTVPADGLAIARMLGHITYLSRESMMKKFDTDRNEGRKMNTKFETKFSVGSYLAYQGDKFVERFDANSYLTLSTAIDLFELGSTPAVLKKSLRKSMCRWLILSFSSDWLFPPLFSRHIAEALAALDKRVNYCDIPSECGHDAFLLPNDFTLYGEMIRAFLKNAAFEIASGGAPPFQRPDRLDYEQILDLIPRGASVLDLGCGKGGLLARLRQREEKRQFEESGLRQNSSAALPHILGLEINEKYVLQCIQRGIDVVQANLNEGLAAFEENQFDFVILSKTLQTIRDVEFVLDEMLRVGRRCIVSFPNLGYREHRRRLSEDGRAPQFAHGAETMDWYSTSDVRFLTLADFEDFCRKKNIHIHSLIPLDTRQHKPVTENPNENADVVVVVVSTG
ncbi:MAG: homoserine O-acetyltransferase [Planctomycetaceae bacterium]|jgi:homoserine O-acetyltransferase|nr:homoserine O-acetyltransferase [Planctomycetaceae bacterium]